MTGLEDIFNQNLAGTPTGTIDMTAAGPFGGTVHITGITSYDQSNGIETVHLKYDMSNCQISSTSSASDLNVNLTLNGVISEHVLRLDVQREPVLQFRRPGPEWQLQVGRRCS